MRRHFLFLIIAPALTALVACGDDTGDDSPPIDDGGEPSTYRISCLGDTATLTGDPAPATADTMCLALNAARVKERIVLGDLAGACTLQYGGPEKANVTGTFDGTEVDTGFHRTDGCGIGDWELLSGILPAPG